LRKLPASLLLAVLVASVALTVGTVSGVSGPPEGTLALFDAVDMDHAVTWVNGSEPGTYPYFDVKVMVTNVSQYYSTVFSLVWDPAILDLTSITAGNATEIPPGVTGPIYFGPSYSEWNHATGELREWVYGQLGPVWGSLHWYNETTTPVWGWVATLTFKFVGSPPAVGEPIDTYINLTYLEAGYKTGWYKLVDYQRRPFATLVSCHFRYETLIHDLAVINVVPSAYIVNVGEPVNIDVVVENQGNVEESFTVKLYAGLSLIGTDVATLAAGAKGTYTFVWTTTAIGNFTIRAEVPPVTGEDDTADNVWTTTVWRIQVISEFPTLTFLLLLMTLILAATIVKKKVWSIKG